MPKKWTVIPDDHVRHVWRCPEGCGAVNISPCFYEASGEPVCEECDSDMEYVRTEVVTES